MESNTDRKLDLEREFPGELGPYGEWPTCGECGRGLSGIGSVRVGARMGWEICDECLADILGRNHCEDCGTEIPETMRTPSGCELPQTLCYPCADDRYNG
jgi:hypothetical protein